MCCYVLLKFHSFWLLNGINKKVWSLISKNWSRNILFQFTSVIAAEFLLKWGIITRYIRTGTNLELPIFAHSLLISSMQTRSDVSVLEFIFAFSFTQWRMSHIILMVIGRRNKICWALHWLHWISSQSYSIGREAHYSLWIRIRPYGRCCKLIERALHIF